MQLLPRRWNYETLVCALRGHVTPAGAVRSLRPQDRKLGIDTEDGRRLARCLRCDAWLDGTPPDDSTSETLPPIDELPRPRRGRTLHDAIVLRIIAIERGIHSVAFTLLALGLILLESNLTRVQRFGNTLAETMNNAVAHTGQQASRSFLANSVNHVTHLHRHEVTVLLVTAVVYAVVEAVEAVGLWHEKRWAEYLTVLATAGFLPFEISALLAKVTTFRVGALVVNVAILVWLVWTKRLFGLRGGTAALEAIARSEAADLDHRMSTVSV